MVPEVRHPAPQSGSREKQTRISTPSPSKPSPPRAAAPRRIRDETPAANASPLRISPLPGAKRPARADFGSRETASLRVRAALRPFRAGAESPPPRPRPSRKVRETPRKPKAGRPRSTRFGQRESRRKRGFGAQSRSRRTEGRSYSMKENREHPGLRSGRQRMPPEAGEAGASPLPVVFGASEHVGMFRKFRRPPSYFICRAKVAVGSRAG
jgi:hypothetical protein